jgi:glycosyltransferase involved in cell wall biosynthesis
MKKFILVSSFSESCGNAYFTQVLIDGLRKKGYDVECASLDLSLTQSMDRVIRKKADKHIDKLCEKLMLADGVNIQFEAGLYGTMPSDIIKRFKKLISANENSSITLHSPRLMGAPSGYREAIRILLTGKIVAAYKKFMEIMKDGLHFRLNKSIIKIIVKHKMKIIVHTERAKEQISKLFDYEVDNIIVHPLKFIDERRLVDKNKLLKLKKQYFINDSDKIVGMFGYISFYKGHTSALEAIKILPNKYKLFIFGRVHPQTIRQGESVDSYINQIGQFIVKNKLQDKVFFIGEVNTEDFIDYAGSVDCVWLPYIEVGQDGSGVASICCDISENVLASNSFAFDELMKLIPYPTVRRFDIGNYLELAQKTKQDIDRISSYAVRNAKYNLTSQTLAYEKAVNF